MEKQERIEKLPDHPTLKKVGYEVSDDDPARKQPLPVAMLSADKIKTIDEMWKWLSRHNIPPDAYAVLSPKLDGLSGLVKVAGYELSITAESKS